LRETLAPLVKVHDTTDWGTPADIERAIIPANDSKVCSRVDLQVASWLWWKR